MLHAARLKYRMQKVARKFASGHHRTTLSGYIFATKAGIDNRKKLVKQKYLLHMSSQYGELWPTRGWDHFVSLGHPSEFQQVVWGTPANFNRFRVLASLLQWRRSTKPTKLGTMFGRLLGWYTIYIHFWGFLPRNGILPGATFTLRPSLALSYFGSVTAWHSSSGRQPNFAVLSKGHHIYSAGRPSHWALAHILVSFYLCLKSDVTVIFLDPDFL